jgi:hypothetical protein
MIMELTEWVKLQLTSNLELRDSNEQLYYLYLKKIGYPIDSVTGKELLKAMSRREIPYLDSIARASRKVQEEHVFLRGKYWKKRKKKSTQIKHEILGKH